MSEHDNPVRPWPGLVLDELAPGPTPAQIAFLSTSPRLVVQQGGRRMGLAWAMEVEARLKTLRERPAPPSTPAPAPAEPPVRVWLSPAERKASGMPMRAGFIGTRQRQRAARQAARAEVNRAKRTGSSPE